MFFKIIFLVTTAILIRGTLPRYRIDQLIILNWKIFLFINILFFNQLVILHLFFICQCSSVVERQTENLKVRSSILFTDIMISPFLLLPFLIKKEKTSLLKKKNLPTKKKKLNSISIHLVSEKKKHFYSFFIYQNFMSIYLQNIFKLNLKEKYINALYTIPHKTTKYILFKMRFKSFKFFKIKYFNEVLFMLIINFWLKNAKNISLFIKRKLDSVHFKRHRAYFLFFFRLIKKYIVPNFTILKLRGVTLKFKGKLGRGGNSRKKTMFFWRGYYSLSNKFLALNRNKWDVWTKTGTVGCTLQIFY